MATYRQLNEDRLDEESVSQASNSEEATFLEKWTMYPLQGEKRRPVFKVVNYFHALTFLANLVFFLLLWQRLGMQKLLTERLVYSIDSHQSRSIRCPADCA